MGRKVVWGRGDGRWKRDCRGDAGDGVEVVVGVWVEKQRERQVEMRWRWRGRVRWRGWRRGGRGREGEHEGG